MRATFYRIVGRVVSPFAIAGLRVWSRLSAQERARIIIINERQEVLFVKGTISDWRWSLPGGGIEKGEDPKTAAIRELYEEIGIRVDDKVVQKIGIIQKGDNAIPYTAHIFKAELTHVALPERPVNVMEIAEIAWFGQSIQPEKLSKVTQKAMELLTK